MSLLNDPRFNPAAAWTNPKTGPLDLGNSSGIQLPGYESGYVDPAKWEALAMQKQGAEESAAADKSMGQAEAQRSEGFDALGRTGGLDSGARERLAKASGKNTLDMQQNIRQQGTQNRLQISQNAETNKIQQTQTEAQARNAYNMQAFDTRMKAWGAEQQARATENSGK